jgi:putative nucleotidyltransferase with HDIG domain
VLGVFSDRPDAFSVEHVRKLMTLSENAVVAMQDASAMSRAAAMYHETIEMVANAIDARCAFHKGHSAHVRAYSGELARALGLPSAQVYRIEDGALLHDIGKVAVPESVLNKPTKLTPAEFEIVAAHPLHGAKMFANSRHLEDIVSIVHHHHEHYDGMGYPDRLEGKEIPLGARIVALGDVFDALVSHRVYRQALDFDTARAAIAATAGAHFDPEIAEVFLSLPLEEIIEH